MTTIKNEYEMTTHGPIYEIVEKGGPQFTFLLSEIEKLEPVWIPVTERIPKLEDKSCLVHWSNGSIEQVHIEDYFREITSGVVDGVQTYTKWYRTQGVTHWMDLPSPPLPLPPNE